MVLLLLVQFLVIFSQIWVFFNSLLIILFSIGLQNLFIPEYM